MENEVYQYKQEKDRISKGNKVVLEEKEKGEQRIAEMESKMKSKEEHVQTLKIQLEKMGKENVRL